MALPSGLTTVTLTGDFSDGSTTDFPPGGTITFTPSKALNVQASGGDVVIEPETITVPISSSGTFSVVLAATDSPQITNQPFTYTVVEHLSGSPSRTYSISLPHATSPVDLTSVDPNT